MKTTIDSLGVAEIDGRLDYVVRVSWRVCADTNKTYEDGTPVEIAEAGKSVFETNQTSSEFIDFGNLTEETVISWISSRQEYINAVATLTARLAQENAPPTMLKEPPWV